MTVLRSVAGLVIGTLFGIGLAVSQMANPEKVLAFLNVLGEWDPSLLFVMGAAVTVTFVGYRRVTHRAPLFAEKHYLPSARDIDGRLLVGAAIFGIGWGLAGYCPGPAITALGSGSLEAPIFVIAMIAGSQLGRLVPSR